MNFPFALLFYIYSIYFSINYEVLVKITARLVYLYPWLEIRANLCLFKF